MHYVSLFVATGGAFAHHAHGEAQAQGSLERLHLEAKGIRTNLRIWFEYSVC